MKEGDKVLISTDLTKLPNWISGTVIEVENNPFVGVVISAKTEDGIIFFGQEDLFKEQPLVSNLNDNNNPMDEMSLDVALDIIGTLRMMKMKEITAEKDESKKDELYKELDMLSTEEKIANGLLQFEVSENVRLSVMDKIQNYYAPKLKAYYESL